MSNHSSDNSSHLVWTGKPWIAPSAVARTALVSIVAIVVTMLESFFNLEYTFASMPLAFWTGLIFFLIWALSLVRLLLLWFSNSFILRNDSLEIRTGILTSRSFVVAASGFADMEVTRSIAGRILDFGDITIRSQDERGSDRTMRTIRNPMKVSDQIREVMSRPFIRLEGQSGSEARK